MPTDDRDKLIELARTIHTAPPEVGRTLMLIAQRRLLRGNGPTMGEVWSMHRYGDTTHLPSDDRQVRTPVGRAGRRLVLRSETDDARALLGVLHDYGVRWVPDQEGSIHLASPVYQRLRPMAVHDLTQAGQWPPRRRYHGRRSLARVVPA